MPSLQDLRRPLLDLHKTLVYGEWLQKRPEALVAHGAVIRVLQA